MNKLTEHQVWTKLTKLWKKPQLSTYDNEVGIYINKSFQICLCFCISRLKGLNLITNTTLHNLRDRINTYKEKHKIKTAYFYPFTLEGAKKRTVLCTHFAKLTKPKKETKTSI